MKFSESQDGIERVSIRITIRLDRQEIRRIRKHLKERGKPTTDGEVREFVANHTETYWPSEWAKDLTDDDFGSGIYR